MAPSSPFLFDASALPTSPVVVAEVPPGIRAKEALFAELAQGLHFPDYFGFNWDALWDCIRDLSWLPVGPIVLKHSDLPLAADPASLKTYLAILRDTAEKRWSGSREHDLIVFFPPETQERVVWVLRSAKRDEDT